MKKIYLFACATLLAFSGCTNEISEDGFVDKTNAISFNAYPTKSRAVTQDVTSDNMKGDHFGVVGYTHNDNKIYLFKTDNDDNKAVEQKYVESSGTWEYADLGDLKFWPNHDMDFYAYFPYSDNATFEGNNKTGDGNDNVMTIPNVNCSHDVLFAYEYYPYPITKIRVPLIFHHAFAKMKKLTIQMPDDGILYKSNCQIEVKEVEFIHTSTSGNIKVDASGTASYDLSTTTPNVTLKETLNSVVTINNTAGHTSKDLFDNDTNAKGYLFATNTTAVNSVIGTGKAMWDGGSITGKLSTSDLVCLKLTCKVWNGTDDNKYYYVGGDGDNYDEVYIPLKGTHSNDNSVTTFNAGKRYTYKIVMKDNVGYTDEGNPILRPILFLVDEVVEWDEVAVTITL